MTGFTLSDENELRKISYEGSGVVQDGAEWGGTERC
jgi:hypothetical protein